MVVVEHVVGVVGAGAVAGIWDWSRGGKGVPWRREGTVFLCMLPRVPVQQVSYTLARERAYFPQNGVGVKWLWSSTEVGQSHVVPGAQIKGSLSAKGGLPVLGFCFRVRIQGGKPPEG